MSKEQEPFVAPNGLSLIEAYIAITGNGHAFPFGVFEDEVPVGFVMVGYDVDESFENPPQIAYGNYSIWRLMIDENISAGAMEGRRFVWRWSLFEPFHAAKRNIVIYLTSLKMQARKGFIPSLAFRKTAKWTAKKQLRC